MYAVRPWTIRQYAGFSTAEAIEYGRRALEIRSALAEANAMIGYSLVHLRRHDEARTALLKEPNAVFRLTGLAIVGRLLGDDAAARKARDELTGYAGESASYRQTQIAAQ